MSIIHCKQMIASDRQYGIFVEPEGNRSMNDILKNHMRSLLAETETAKKTIEVIEKKYPFWLWQWYVAEAANIHEYLFKLESEVTLIEVDCIEAMGSTYNDDNNRFFDECYFTYMSLEGLIEDLRSVRVNLGNPSAYYSNVKQMKYDWIRFSEIVSEVYEELKSNELDSNYRLM